MAVETLRVKYGLPMAAFLFQWMSPLHFVSHLLHDGIST